MPVIIGYLVSLVCVFGVFIMHGGNIGVVLKALPFEMATIGGAAFGAFIINNQPKVLKATMKAMGTLLKGSKYTKAGSDHHVVEFTTDYLRMMVSGNLNAHEIEALMDNEIETHHQEAHAPVAAMARLAGGLPAFGIVAAVLGVVNTMGSVGQPPAVLGGMVGSALVGTFLGILLAYAFVEPLGGLMEQKADDAAKELLCIKCTLLASMQGYNPATAIEFGRKVLFSTERPSFLELEEYVRKK